jgi:hypothetical protein
MAQAAAAMRDSDAEHVLALVRAAVEAGDEHWLGRLMDAHPWLDDMAAELLAATWDQGRAAADAIAAAAGGYPGRSERHAEPESIDLVALAFEQAISGQPSARELVMARYEEALRRWQDFALWELELELAGRVAEAPDSAPADRRGSGPGPRGQGRNLPAHRSTGPPARPARRITPVSLLP